MRIGRADATAPAARLGSCNADRHRGRGRPGLDPRVQSGPAERLDIGRSVFDASIIAKEDAYRNVRSVKAASLRPAPEPATLPGTGGNLNVERSATLRWNRRQLCAE